MTCFKGYIIHNDCSKCRASGALVNGLKSLLEAVITRVQEFHNRVIQDLALYHQCFWEEPVDHVKPLKQSVLPLVLRLATSAEEVSKKIQTTQAKADVAPMEQVKPEPQPQEEVGMPPLEAPDQDSTTLPSAASPPKQAAAAIPPKMEPVLPFSSSQKGDKTHAPVTHVIDLT